MIPNDLFLSAEQGEAFLRAVEAAQQAGNAHQYFVWQRLHLHRFIPHEVALCAIGAPAARDTQVHLLHSVPLAPALAQALRTPDSLLWRALLAAWRRAGRAPVQVALDDPALAPLVEVQALLALNFRAVLIHGVDDGQGMSPAMLHAFACTGVASAVSDSSRCAALALWLPCLHFAALRVFSAAAPGDCTSGKSLVSGPVLTARELQILAAVRDAQRNAQIGEQLGISPMTVKNHLRKIMRKLGATNRAQAVAEAMSHRLIS